MVVRHSSSTPGMAETPRQMSRMPRRTRGSPPVRRTFRTPQSTAAAAIPPSSSTEQMPARSRLAAPDAGIQYRHRREQRSVTERRR